MASQTNQPPITHDEAMECVRKLNQYLAWSREEYKRRTGIDLGELTVMFGCRDFRSNDAMIWLMHGE